MLDFLFHYSISKTILPFECLFPFSTLYEIFYSIYSIQYLYGIFYNDNLVLEISTDLFLLSVFYKEVLKWRWECYVGKIIL